MADARIEKVYEDRIGAREFFSQAEGFMKDSDRAGLSGPSRAVLLHNAAISACDAILQAAGLRVTQGDGAHSLRLEAALEQTDADTDELLERLDAARMRRNEASYAAVLVAQASISDACEATAELIELAREYVGPVD